MRVTEQRQQLDPTLRSPEFGRNSSSRCGRRSPARRRPFRADLAGLYQVYTAGLSPSGRPVGNFLFLGPTGSGKTRIVEATAETLLKNPRVGASRSTAPSSSTATKSPS